ncbi:hypothetical protein MEL_036 [Melbournevirus]|uniref:hypothetical protein n=1 Tax=Melbournevirus TaxID=1560514 RepID=UPI00051F55D0|nr:hypothetical protein MEL_036 [Melbournevirus]
MFANIKLYLDAVLLNDIIKAIELLFLFFKVFLFFLGFFLFPLAVFCLLFQNLLSVFLVVLLRCHFQLFLVFLSVSFFCLETGLSCFLRFFRGHIHRCHCITEK